MENFNHSLPGIAQIGLRICNMRKIVRFTSGYCGVVLY